MNYKKVNLYNRLRDYYIPLSILDSIFKDDNDFQTLKNAYDSLVKDGYSKDSAASKIASIVIMETGTEPNYGLSEEE